MNWTPRTEEPVEIEEIDPTLRQALGEFRASVHAWSEAELSRPRTVEEVVRHRTWRVAAGWGLTAALLLGTLSSGVYAYHERQVEARAAAAREAEHQKQLAEQRQAAAQRTEDELLADVDTDVSREVPSAMEPLAQLNDVTETAK